MRRKKRLKIAIAYREKNGDADYQRICDRWKGKSAGNNRLCGEFSREKTRRAATRAALKGTKIF
jgi:hypothetical protein